MKKLVLIGLVIGLTAVAIPNASAKPTGLSTAELRALMINHERVADSAPLRRYVNPPYGGLPSFPAVTSVSTSSGSTDFQWGDAGVGAAGILALLALAGAAILGVRRYYRGNLRTS